MPVRTALRHLRHARGVPCLGVGDVEKAVTYYERFFGFTPVTRDPHSALLLGHGATLRLSRDDGAPATAVPATTGPDVAIVVRQPEILRRRLDDLGAHLVPTAQLGAGWDNFFGIRDCYGNVIAIGPASCSAPLRWIAQPVDLTARRVHDWRQDRAQRRHLASFRDFYDRLPSQRDIFYIHVNTSLLHWLVKTVAYVPDEINLVVIGSDLAPPERAWVAATIPRPFHHVEVRLDDAGVMELLFAVNREHFGWLDLGCLVLNAEIFDEIATLSADTSLNCVWSWDSGHGFPIANTYLCFVNVNAAERVSHIGVGPGVYAYDRVNRQVEGRRYYSGRATRALRRRIGAVLPADRDGRPIPPGGLATFDPTVMFQLVARTFGLEINAVRPLTGFNHILGADIADDGSDELFYIGGLSRADVLEEFSGYFHDAGVRLLYAIAEFVTLAPTADWLPAPYAERRDAVSRLLAEHGLGAGTIENACHDHLVTARGLSPGTADAIMRAPARLVA